VMFTSLSALSHDRERMGQAYRKAFAVIGAIGFPLAVGLAVTAPETIRLIYGPKWAPVAPILFWLSIAGISQPIYYSIGWLFLASGRSRTMFQWGVASTAVLACGFLAGLNRGPIGIAVAYALTMGLVLTLPALLLAHRAASISLRVTLRTVTPFFVAALVMGALTTGAAHILAVEGADWRVALILKILIGIVVYVSACRRRLTYLLSDVFSNLKIHTAMPV